MLAAPAPAYTSLLAETLARRLQGLRGAGLERAVGRTTPAAAATQNDAVKINQHTRYFTNEVKRNAAHQNLTFGDTCYVKGSCSAAAKFALKRVGRIQKRPARAKMP